MALCGEATRSLRLTENWRLVTCPECVAWMHRIENHDAPSRAMAQAPSHYKSGQHDLYAAFIDAFGFDAWAQHAELECIQYLWRCRKKGSYAEDIRKVVVICQRILEERSLTNPTNVAGGSGGHI